MLAGLHDHGEYSLLDGAGTAAQHVEAAKAAGYVALALTDHGTLAGSLHHMRACRDGGITPVVGCEVYYRPNRKVQGQKEWLKTYYHLTLHAKNGAGWRNLMSLVSESHRSGFYGKACVDDELLEKYSEGLMCLTGCLGGRLCKSIITEQDREAEAWLRQLKRIFRDDLFVEIMPHDIDEQRTANVEVIRMAQRHGIPIVTTLDAHYPTEDWAPTQDVLLMIATNQTRKKREKKREEGEDVYEFGTKTFFHQTEERIREEYAKYHPEISSDIIDESLRNTIIAAMRTTPFLVDRSEKMPAVSVPRDITPDAHLRRLVYEGLQKRPGKRLLDPVYTEGIEHELETFAARGQTNYMLLVAIIVAWCKSTKPVPKRVKGEMVYEPGVLKKPIMVGPGRGSAAGSKVAWALGITNLNPVNYRCLFERFVNPARVGLPDIDLDFPPDRVDEVEEFVKVLIGKDRVVDIIAHSTFGPRAALTDVGRVLSIPYEHVKSATKTIDDQERAPLQKLRLVNPKVDQLLNQYPELDENATRIQGMVARKSEHAGGLLLLPDITPEGKVDASVEDFIPVERTGGQKGKLLSAFGERAGKGNALISDYGYVKLDVLRVAELTKQQHAVDLIAQRTGNVVDLDALEIHDDPLKADPKVMQGFKDGLLVGIFQFCLAGDTILNGEPRKTIKELFHNPPDKLTSIDLGQGRKRRNKVERIWEAGEKMLYRVNTSSNYTLRATADHKVLTREGWKRVGDLTPDDEIAVNEADASRIGCCSSCGKQTKSRRGQCYKCSNEGRGFQSWSSERRSEAMKAWHADPANREAWKARNRRMADSGVLKGKNNPAYGKSRSFLVGQSRHRQHLRDDIPHRVRSSWEADYARYLMHEGIEYLYESRAFELSNGTTYRPDFYLVEADKYVEIKGWWRPGDREKIDCFKGDYPDLDLVIIDSHAWAEFQLEHRDLVPNWECPELPPRFSFDHVVSVDEDQVEMTYDVSMADPMNNFIANGMVVHNSATANKLTRQLKPDTVLDLALINAGIRPGPRGAGADQRAARRKNGLEPITYWHKSLEPYLDYTYGEMFFQEQLIEVVHHLGGLTRASADIFRKIASKLYRDPDYAREVMGEWEMPIKDSMREKGLDDQSIEVIWANLLSFSDYSFNLAHAAGYAVLAYRDMWLKVYYPREFYAAFLSKGLSQITKKKALQKQEAAREMRSLPSYITPKPLNILPPDINVSGRDYTVVEEGIRLGLESIKHIGPRAAAAIEEHRPFVDFQDFEKRVPGRACNITGRGALVMAGAFDLWGFRNEFTEERIDELERELIGMSLTSVHSIQQYAHIIEGRFWSEDEIDAAPDGTRVTIMGEVVGMKDDVIDKKGGRMAFVDLAYGPNNWNCTFFSYLWSEYEELVKSRRPLMITGVVDTYVNAAKGINRRGITVESLPPDANGETTPPIMDIRDYLGLLADTDESLASDSIFPEDLAEMLQPDELSPAFAAALAGR